MKKFRRFWAINNLRVCEGRTVFWRIRHFNAITKKSIKRQLLRDCCMWIFYYFSRIRKTDFNKIKFPITFCKGFACKYIYNDINYRNHLPSFQNILRINLTKLVFGYIVKLYSERYNSLSWKKPQCLWVISNQEDRKNNHFMFQSNPHVHDDMKETALDHDKWLLGIQRRLALA